MRLIALAIARKTPAYGPDPNGARMRIILLAPLLLAAALPQSTSPAIEAALADPARGDQAGDDARRRAAAVLAFAGVRPG